MLTQDDRDAINSVFDGIERVAQRAEPRDRQAEDLIIERLDRVPTAPYYMAQTLLIQQHALQKAEERIAALEEEVRSGKAEAANAPGPWGRERGYQSGGFLSGAAQTAMGVAGGILLVDAIQSMFGAGAAQAAEAQWQEQAAGNEGTATEAPAEPAGLDDDPRPDDLGGDDFGGFDGGGDFGFGGDF